MNGLRPIRAASLPHHDIADDNDNDDDSYIRTPTHRGEIVVGKK